MTDHLIYKIQIGDVSVDMPMAFFGTLPEIKKLIRDGGGNSKDPQMICASLMRAIIEEVVRDGVFKISIETETE